MAEALAEREEKAVSSAALRKTRMYQILEQRDNEVRSRECSIRKLSAELHECEPGSSAVEDISFPLLPQKAAAMPNEWTRTSLFSNFKKGDRRIFKKELIEGRDDCRVRVSGEGLDMYDNDVFLHIVQKAQGVRRGEVVYFERASFLRAIGRGADLSSESYENLQKSMERLFSYTIFFEQGGKGGAFRLIDKLVWDKVSGYWLAMDPEVISLFARSYLAYIDMDVRLRLKSPFAKYLQNYVSGHAVGVHKISWASLMRWSGSVGRPGDFRRRALQPALHELEREGLITEWRVDESVVSWVRLAHARSRKKG
ncbi:RepB family plasmid replication initiator protein [Pseudomonas asturiensis]|uniref:RepB family plasmid replication initiator protein n=1 Tax=Pseudomonas asturiensis TaxID=1190415 RepID=A0ABX6HG86_9PSED|nr:replication initiation protein [Pseudomonas asturiensis]QHF04339.1 RepB family plasmid replication initiator protein [Pseudomonas asturiensis]